MKPHSYNSWTGLDIRSSNSDDDSKSSDEQESLDGNIVDENEVHSSDSKETTPGPTGASPHIIHNHPLCNSDPTYTVTCTVSMVLAVPRGAKSFSLSLQRVFRVVKIKIVL